EGYKKIHIAVLDYVNHMSYLCQTDCLNPADSIYIKDITGDGKDDIILSTTPNTVWNWNLICLVQNTLVDVYRNWDSNNLENRNYKVSVEKGSKLVIQSVDGTYKEEIALLELGFEKKMVSDSDWHWAKIGFLSQTSENENCFENANAKDGIKLQLNVVYDNLIIGALEVTLKCNEQHGNLYIAGQKIHVRDMSDKSKWEYLK
ncbi:MAG: hypothetical protein K6G65_06360, partial [Lachnospiraceae bacterium]|nr:hypothetical protein [Lachnospiraceae bacterium]